MQITYKEAFGTVVEVEKTILGGNLEIDEACLLLSIAPDYYGQCRKIVSESMYTN